MYFSLLHLATGLALAASICSAGPSSKLLFQSKIPLATKPVSQSKIPLATKTLSNPSALKTHNVVAGVGNNTRFSPDWIVANVGDTVVFYFNPAAGASAPILPSFVPAVFRTEAHSVIQASFDFPCVPIALGSPGKTGYYSGKISSYKGDNRITTFTFTIENEDPIWFYCGNKDDCRRGMVGVINPPKKSNQTIEKFRMNARKVKETTAILPTVVKGTVSTQTLKTGTAWSPFNNYNRTVVKLGPTATTATSNYKNMTKSANATSGLTSSSFGTLPPMTSRTQAASAAISTGAAAVETARPVGLFAGLAVGALAAAAGVYL
ncbi:MAG: hypothetical protein M1814_001206 [Vezdaea aestivalis]|nr:MAG: hypothetical protein M1814_001206 [Vezdaea aestivalis]